MNHYEVTFIVDPVLSGDEIKATAQTYVDHLTTEGCTIVHVDEMGLRPLAFPINRRSSGIYYCVEFSNENGAFLGNLELSLRRDERIMRFLTVKLDKYGVKYNEDKRNGLIGKKKKKAEAPKEEAPVERPQERKAPKVQAVDPDLVEPDVPENPIVDTPADDEGAEN
jgi:small subunit ribosomal protein S6